VDEDDNRRKDVQDIMRGVLRARNMFEHNHDMSSFDLMGFLPQ